ncbi:MAG: beta-ketoacyl-ACP reductase [Thermoplasmata archaeon]|nr:beta-ketoacyl-ACP reductase [Thermoplasmata archaeon]TFG70956.1 MAG: beta-ketoacyl-ACP reductase [Methanomassiliicoccus sp.]
MLDGKTALVTGGSRGIGQAIAIKLAGEGADVAVNYQSGKDQAADVIDFINKTDRIDNLDELIKMIDIMDTVEQAKEVREMIESMGRHAIICQANVGRMDEVNKMRDNVVAEFGKIDILVNNAGIVKDKSFVNMTSDMWDDVISVNLTGTFNCTKAVIDGMLERNYGRIVNISSVIGRMGNRGQANYAASKAGIIGLTQTLAKEFADKGVTVNAVAPGFIGTDMLKSVPAKIMVKVLAQIPMGRLGKPEEVASAVSYLVSPEAGYITGQVIDINGGLYI